MMVFEKTNLINFNINETLQVENSIKPNKIRTRETLIRNVK